MKRIRSYTEQKHHESYPHLGKLISNILKNKKVSKLELSRLMGVRPTTVSNYLKNASLQLGIIWNISFALKYDILSEIIDYYPQDFPINQTTKLAKELQEKTNKIKELEKEIEIYSKVLKQ
jgi:transcriptional regulator with XRE-family HTH domain